MATVVPNEEPLAVQNDKGGDAVDSIALFKRLDHVLRGVRNCEPWHESEVSLKSVIIAVYGAEHNFELLSVFVCLIVEVFQDSGEKTARRSPVSAKVDSNKLCRSNCISSVH